MMNPTPSVLSPAVPPFTDIAITGKHPYRGNRVHGIGIQGPIEEWEGVPSVMVCSGEKAVLSPVLRKLLRKSEDNIVTE